jgi:hypothetical protein
MARHLFGEGHPQCAQSLAELAEIAAAQGAWSVAERSLTEALVIRRANLPAEHPLLAKLQRALAEVLIRRGKWAAAEPLLDEAQRIVERVFGATHPQMAQIYCGQARVCIGRGRHANADRLAHQALSVLGDLLNEHDPALALAHRLLAQVALARHDVIAATRHANMAVRIVDAQPLASDQERCDCLLIEGEALCAAEDWAYAQSSLQRATALLKQLGKDYSHPDLVTAYRLRATVSLRCGADELAWRDIQKAHAVADLLPERAAPELTEVAAVFSDVYLRRGDFRAAANLAEQELTLRERLHGSEHPSMRNGLLRLGDARTALTEYTAAQAAYQRALTLTERMVGATPTDLSACVERLGRLSLAQRDFEGFKPWMQRALQLMETGPQTAPRAMPALDEFVESLQAAGRMSDAVALAEELASRRSRQMHVLGELL